MICAFVTPNFCIALFTAHLRRHNIELTHHYVSLRSAVFIGVAQLKLLKLAGANLIICCFTPFYRQD